MGEKVPTQNHVLRLFDISILACFCGYMLLIAQLFSGLRVGPLIATLIELSIGVSYLILGLRAKKKVKVAGQWKKLSFREKIDLHEWRRSNW